MSGTILAAPPPGIPANCQPPVFPWESQYEACFKAGYNLGSHGSFSQNATGMLGGHGPGPVMLLLIVVGAFLLLRGLLRARAAS